jgi:hypothetical protein
VNIGDEAVEALARVLAQEALVEADMAGAGWDAENDSPEPFMPRARERARAYLEAAAPILLSHERQLTADAHRDAIVNRDTVDRLERELETAKADAWDEGRLSYRDDLAGTPRFGTPGYKETPNPYRSQP